ncbi:PhzA/PhzB family protein [Roseospira marina]|nr:PhzA/PhzB family protein [Roseospira marina]MBB4316017.1 ketosteroid isomerase-like protein [Roseospira marina]MBB5089183.1 ketosteroid isomerase-like protein [Roseospira marina]
MALKYNDAQRTSHNEKNVCAYINRRTVDSYLSTKGRDRKNRHQYFTDDGVCISVFSNSGLPTIIKGKAALARLGSWVDAQFPDWEWVNAHVYPSRDGTVFIVECTGVGTAASADVLARTTVPYIHIFTVRNGLISEVREYSDMRQKYRLLSAAFPATDTCPFYPL